MPKAILYKDWELNFRKKKKLILIIYYSRTGTTKRVADKIIRNLDCYVVELFDTANREGLKGFLRLVLDALRKKLTILLPITKDPASSDIIVLGTPIWVNTMSTPIRTYIVENKEKFKKVAFFCTEKSRGGEKCFEKMAKLCGKDPVATLEIKSKDCKKNQSLKKIEKFTNELKREMQHISKNKRGINSLGLPDEDFKDFMKIWKEKNI